MSSFLLLEARVRRREDVTNAVMLAWDMLVTVWVCTCKHTRMWMLHVLVTSAAGGPEGTPP